MTLKGRLLLQTSKGSSDGQIIASVWLFIAASVAYRLQSLTIDVADIFLFLYLLELSLTVVAPPVNET